LCSCCTIIPHKTKLFGGSTAQRTGDRIVRAIWTPSSDAALVTRYLGAHELARTQLEERDSGPNPTTATNEVPRVRTKLHESSRSWHSFQPRQSWGHRTTPTPLPRSNHQLIRTWHYYRPLGLTMDPARRAQIIGYLLLPRHHLHECNYSFSLSIQPCVETTSSLANGFPHFSNEIGGYVSKGRIVSDVCSFPKSEPHCLSKRL